MIFTTTTRARNKEIPMRMMINIFGLDIIILTGNFNDFSFRGNFSRKGDK